LSFHVTYTGIKAKEVIAVYMFIILL